MALYIATQKYVQMTPRKLRLMADVARKMTPEAVIELLPYSKRRSADPIVKTVMTAIANARQAGADTSKLVFHQIEISQGPALARGIAVSRGQWHPLKKRMSHVRIVLTEKAEKKTEKKAQKDVTVEVTAGAKPTKTIKKATAKKTVKK